jgi:hypothetical protein
MSKASGVKGYPLGFITGAGCNASGSTRTTARVVPTARDTEDPEIQKIRSAGGDVIVSFGGASGSWLARACSSVSGLAAEYQAAVKAYSLK